MSPCQPDEKACLNDGVAQCVSGRFDVTECPTGMVYALLVHLGAMRTVILTVVQVSSISHCGFPWDLREVYVRVRKYPADSCDWGVLHTS